MIDNLQQWEEYERRMAKRRPAMHPVDLDKLLETVPQPYEPVKHVDSPYCLQEHYNGNGINPMVVLHTNPSGKYRTTRDVFWFDTTRKDLDPVSIEHETFVWRNYKPK